MGDLLKGKNGWSFERLKASTSRNIFCWKSSPLYTEVPILRWSWALLMVVKTGSGEGLLFHQQGGEYSNKCGQIHNLRDCVALRIKLIYTFWHAKISKRYWVKGYWIRGDYIMFLQAKITRMYIVTRVSLVAQMVKNQPAIQETLIWSLGWRDPLEKGMVIHSSILAWRIPGQKSLVSYRSQGHRAGHDWARNTYI